MKTILQNDLESCEANQLSLFENNHVVGRPIKHCPKTGAAAGTEKSGDDAGFRLTARRGVRSLPGQKELFR